MVKEGEQSEPSINKVPDLVFLSFGYHVILPKGEYPPCGKATGKLCLSYILRELVWEAYVKADKLMDDK